MRRHVIPILIAALLAGGVSAAQPGAAAADNAAIAINTKDGTTVFKVAFAIRHVMSDVVDETNAAVAYNSCSDCDSVAIAFEIVLIEGDASTITPTNIAIAFNENCTTCVAVAEAYQFVLGDGGLGHFDAAGNQILAQIRRELHSMKTQDLTIAELQALLDDISARIADVLAHHLVAVGPRNAPETSTVDTTTTAPAATTTAPDTTTAPMTTAETTTTEPTTSTTADTTTTTTTP
jgi:putative peptide zinc metalloprotease protein